MKTYNKKRGFTIVELVIVVAVIAILAAVLIPTFTSIIRKSRESSDQQAVRNMNTILSAEGAVKPLNPEEMFAALEANGIDAEDYKPLYKDRYFFWDSAKNVIVYTDANYNVLYPANATDSKQANWCTLSGKIGEELSEDKVKDLVADNVATVGNANELVSLAKAINDKKVTAVKEIKLPETLNLMGADISINEKVASSLTISGPSKENPTELTGLVDSEAVKLAQENKMSGSTRNNYTGMVGQIAGKVVVEFKNITIANAFVGDKSASQVGLLVGGVQSGATVKMTNVTVKDSTVLGLQKVGGLVGMVQGAKVEIEDCTMENVTVQATQGCAGGIFGYMNGNSYVKVDNATALVEDVKVELVKIQECNYVNYERTQDGLVDTWLGINMAAAADGSLSVEDELYENGTCYRYFASCAKYGFVPNGGHKLLDGLTGYQGKGIVLAYNATPVMPKADNTAYWATGTYAA